MSKSNVTIKSSKVGDKITPSLLKKAGWVLANDPATTDKPLADTGKPATNRPRKERVLTDPNSPVTASKAEVVIQPEDSKRDDSTKNDRNLVFAALRVAELEEAIGLDSKWDGGKLQRVASLETNSYDELSTRISTLEEIKESGLTRKKSSVTTSQGLPRLAGTAKTVEEEPALDEALFI